MSYEPTTWRAGDTVTSAKLNKIEQGIANSGIMVVESEFDSDTQDVTLHLTPTEAIEAFQSKQIIITFLSDESMGHMMIIFHQLGPGNDDDIYRLQGSVGPIFYSSDLNANFSTVEPESDSPMM